MSCTELILAHILPTQIDAIKCRTKGRAAAAAANYWNEMEYIIYIELLALRWFYKYILARPAAAHIRMTFYFKEIYHPNCPPTAANDDTTKNVLAFKWTDRNDQIAMSDG